MKQNFQKNKVVTGKTLFFVTGPFCTHHSICLIMVSGVAVLYRNDVFSVLVLSTKKRCPSFLEKVFRFSENLFES